MAENIFVFGLTDFHSKYLREIPDPDRYRFHGLLSFDELVAAEEIPLDQLLAKAERQLREFPEPIAAIITHWDFPASTMQPILCQRFGLRSATIEAVLKCEHKYWSRLEQQRAVPDMTPNFCAVDPFAEDVHDQITVDFPYWIKPIRGFGSQLGFRIESRDDLDWALPIIRRKIHRIGRSFDVALGYADLPKEVAPVTGSWCIAEELVYGKQCGIEGYVHEGEFQVHGVVDGVKDSHNQSFTRWEYPSAWPRHVQRRMCESAERLLRQMGYDNQPFGVEFFWDEYTNHLSLLEINTRISQSHSEQFVQVDGASNHEVAVKVALGEQPQLKRSSGEFKIAAKFMLRRYHDAVVTRVPSQEEIEQIESLWPGTTIEVTAKPGMRVSDVVSQESYSFEIAEIWLGAQSQDDLLEKYHEVANRLNFQFSDGSQIEEFQFDKVRY